MQNRCAENSGIKGTRQPGMSQRKRGIGRILLAAIGVGGLGQHSWAGITVMQVESAGPGVGNAFPGFAPVTYTGSNTATSATYPGITFTTQYTPYFTNTNGSNTYSAHADTVVGQAMYGAGTVGGTVIDKVVTEAAIITDSGGNIQSMPAYTSLIGGVSSWLKVTLGNGGAVPAATPTGVRVVNSSYVLGTLTFSGTFNGQPISADNNTTFNNGMSRRPDFVVNRDGVTWVAGAATLGLPAISAAWVGRNVIAVRGDQVFDPNVAPAGRRHPDLWLSGLASASSATVAGYAAALVNVGTLAGNAAQQDPRVIKSVFMTGADKTNWTPSTANNLDPQNGAGMASYTGARELLTSTQRNAYTLTAGTGANQGTNTGSTLASGAALNVGTTWGNQGWTFGSVAASGATAVPVSFQYPVIQMAVTLNWNSRSFLLSGTLDDLGPLQLADLGLALQTVTTTGSTLKVGAKITAQSGQALLSDSAGTNNDNVESLYVKFGSFGTLGTAVNAGNYAFAIRGDITGTQKENGGTTTAFGLSYKATYGSYWQVDADGTYGVTTNWTGNWAPSDAGVVAVFPNVTTTGRTVTYSSNVTLGSMSFTGGTYALTTGNGSGITLSNGTKAGLPTIQIDAGSPVIAVPITVNNSASVSFTGNGSAVTLGSVINNPASTLYLQSSGAGGGKTVTMTGSLAGGGTLNVESNTALRISNAGFAGSHALVVDQGNLTIGAGAKVIVTGESYTGSGGRAVQARVLVANTISISSPTTSGGGLLDLGNSDLIVKGMTEPAVRALVSSWYSGGTRAGKGIGSYLAGTSGNDLFATLAVVSNSNLLGGVVWNTFDGVSVSAGNVVVKYTYFGDTNLDGQVNVDDYNAVVLALADQSLTGWRNGDFNYDGVINLTDLNLLVASQTGQGSAFEVSPDSGTAVTAVAGTLGTGGSGGSGGGTNGGDGTGGAIPEPSSAGMILLGGLGLLGTRKRREIP